MSNEITARIEQGRQTFLKMKTLFMSLQNLHVKKLRVPSIFIRVPNCDFAMDKHIVALELYLYMRI